MSTKTLLNALRQQDRRLPEPVPGRWKPYDNFLVDYAADIAIQGVTEDRRGMANVPSVFARPIHFAQVLRDERHPAYRAVLGQWRGLLAAFALSDWLDLTLAAQRIDVPPRPEAEPAGTRALWTILRSQLPNPPEEWDHWWLLLCDDRSIGATSPWTIVYTPAECRCPASIPWQREGAFIDPLAHYDPSRRGRSVELSLLAVWLDRVCQGAGDLWDVVGRSTLSPYLQIVARRLEEWRSELDGYVEEAHRGLVWEPSSRIAEAPYARFLGRLQSGGETPPSDLLLAGSADRPTVLLSRTSLQPAQRVYGPVRAADVDLGRLAGPEGEAGWKARSGRQVPVRYLIAEEAFFPPKLARIRLADAGWSAGADELALPLTARFLRHFTVRDLIEGKVRLEIADAESTVTVRLRLPVSGGAVEVEKVYDRDEDLVGDLGTTPGLGHWPDFFDPTWPYNYALASKRDGTVLDVAPLPWDGEPLRATGGGGEKPLRVWSSPRPIAGFVLYAGGNGEAHEAGLVLRRELRPPLPPVEGLAWRVAVDFGTSNTHVLVAEENEVRPLVLKGRTVLLTQPAEPLAEAVAVDFLPASDVAPPFPTLLLRDAVSFLGGERSPRGAFTVRFRSLGETEGLVGSLVQDVKWSSGGTAEASPMRDYLNGLTRCLLCEAWAAGVTHLRFAWSYPLSLSPEGHGAMDGFWGATARSLPTLRAAGDGRSEIVAEAGTSESVALCRYLYRAKALEVGAGALSIAVDVGGGSSDVGFWIRGALCDQLSMKIAANDILTGFAASEEFVRELQRLCEPNGRNRRSLDDFKRRPAVLLNSLLVKAQPVRGADGAIDPDAHPVARALAAMELHRAEPPWQGVRSLIYLFGLGLAFYLGLQSRRLIQGIQLNEVKVGFAGRGASLFSWVATGRTLEPTLEHAFATGLAVGDEGSQAASVQVVLPGGSGRGWSRLKQEAAHGLLEPPLQREETGRSDRTIAGEVNWTDATGKPLDWKAAITAPDLRTLIPPPNHDSGYMAHLVTHVLPRFAEELALDRAGLAALRLRSAKVQNLLTFPDDRLVVVQPLFAYELTALMESYLGSYLSEPGERR